jgi:phytoene dehydrogenase-like protein
MQHYDCVIVGAGHNGLVCACYLAKAGMRVLVVERRPIVGGAVCTEELIPGYRFDVGSSAHIMFRSTPIMDELQLAAHGLEYIEMDPWAFHPILGTDQSISFYRSLDRTCESIASVSRRDAEAYRAFVLKWGELNEGVFEVFLKTPTPGSLFGTMLKRNILQPRSRKLWSSLDTTRQLMTSYGHLINETFEHESVRAALTWLAAQSGPGPDEIATGDFFGWQSMIHKHGAWRAKGGSGALTQALARRLESLGGEILTDAPVTKISGKFEVETSRGTFTTRGVVAACHVQTTFLNLLDPAICPPTLRKRVEKIKVGNGFGMIVRHAVSELPRYAGQPEGVAPCHSALQLLCPSRHHLDEAYLDYLRKQPPRKPAVLAMTFSSIDPTLAPPGKHVLFTWAQYHPYELGNGENWDAIAEREADKLYNAVCDYAPNMRGQMLGRFIQTPLEIERRLGLLRANVMHVEMSFDQMFSFRPLPELSGYRTPVRGLYLTGASTHPGGGVFGASGRNAAQVVHADFRKRKF